MSAPLTRILLRYVSGILTAKGLLAPEWGNVIAADPDVFQAAQLFISSFLGLLAEGWYYLAVKMGWAK